MTDQRPPLTNYLQLVPDDVHKIIRNYYNDSNSLFEYHIVVHKPLYYKDSQSTLVNIGMLIHGRTYTIHFMYYPTPDRRDIFNKEKRFPIQVTDYDELHIAETANYIKLYRWHKDKFKRINYILSKSNPIVSQFLQDLIAVHRQENGTRRQSPNWHDDVLLL